MDQQTINTYNQLAQEYDEETITFWEEFPRGFLEKFSSLAKGKVLDVGSGPGRDGLLLKKKGLEVICLDASQAMVDLCQAKGLEAVLGDFNNLPFAAKTFGGVWAYTSLLHVPKQEINKPLQEISRVLEDGGYLGLGLIEGEGEGYRESSGLNLPRWFSFYGQEEVEAILEANNFAILHFDIFKPKSRRNFLNFIAVKK